MTTPDFIIWLREWTETLWTIGAAAVAVYIWLRTLINKTNREQNTRIETIESGQKALLYAALFSACREMIGQGYSTVEGLDNLKFLYNAYKAHGMNGTGEALYKKCLALTIRERLDND